MVSTKRDKGSVWGIQTNPDNAVGSQVEPLELLIVSNKKEYRTAGEEYFVPLTTSEGSTLFNVATVSKDELAASLIPPTDNDLKRDVSLEYRADIVLFHLENRPLTNNLQLPLLDEFLSTHKRCYAIASLVNDEQLLLLLDSPQWVNLQRDVVGRDQQRDVVGRALPLTQSYRVGSRVGGNGEIGKDGYALHFSCLTREILPEPVLALVRQLKYDQQRARPKIEVIKRIFPFPTKFLAFSESMRKKFKSELVARSLDIIAGFNPDDTLSELEEIKQGRLVDNGIRKVATVPFDMGYSVPQHCYPPFEQLNPMSQEDVLPRIQGQGANPLSFYVHIPFCASSCTYCDYTTITKADRETQTRYLGMLGREMDTIYKLTGWQKLSPQGMQIGGGTPSVLSPKLIDELGIILRQHLSFPKDNFQLTFEVSPGTTTPEKLDAFKGIGANRVSIGLQSVSDMALLNWVERYFSTAKGKKTIEWLLERWPNSTNIDMMYGLPGQTAESWERDLNDAIELGVPSVNFYDLRISPRTKFIEGQEFPQTYERMLMFVMAMQKFLEAGYVQSSDNQFVKSIGDQPYVYKTAKKKGGNTLGIGLSSYSIFPGLIYFNIGGRYNKNPNNLKNYSRALEQGRLPVEIGRILDGREQMRLFMTQGLKLSGIGKDNSGVDMVEFRNRFGKTIDDAFPNTSVLSTKGLLKIKDNYLGLTYKGLAFEQPILKTYWR